MSPQMVNVNGVNLHDTCKDLVNAPHLGENKRSHTQDVESIDSSETQSLVVLPERLICENFTFRYIKRPVQPVQNFSGAAVSGPKP
jgi:hypothetical protein